MCECIMHSENIQSINVCPVCLPYYNTNRSSVDIGLVRAGNQFDDVLVSVFGSKMQSGLEIEYETKNDALNTQIYHVHVVNSVEYICGHNYTALNYTLYKQTCTQFHRIYVRAHCTHTLSIRTFRLHRHRRHKYYTHTLVYSLYVHTCAMRDYHRRA